MVKNLPATAGDTRDMGLIPGSGRFPWKGKWPSFPLKRLVLTIIFIYLFIQARFTAAAGGARINKSFPHTIVSKL